MIEIVYNTFVPHTLTYQSFKPKKLLSVMEGKPLISWHGPTKSLKAILISPRKPRLWVRLTWQNQGQTKLTFLFGGII